MSILTKRLSSALLFLLVGSNATAAEFGSFDNDGWYSWRVEAIEAPPTWCCINWQSGKARPQACNLQKTDGSFSNDPKNPNNTGQMQIYVRVLDGKAKELRTLSPQCPVTSTATINDLGIVENIASVDWLKYSVGVDKALSTNALAAIAVHAGNNAVDALLAASGKSSQQDVREDAIFWMGQLRAAETGKHIERYMFADSDADIREHAAFSISQSTAENRADLLIRQGRDDASAEVRSQAWFWLAQTGLPEAETAIGRALLDDADREVREQAVFALSQLPGGRAVSSLLAVLENRQLDRHSREQALFWLAQSDSAEAYEKIQQLIAGKL